MNVRDVDPVEAPDYRLIRRIGSSSAASVYAATDLSNGRPLAVKTFHRFDADRFARLERQLQANAQLAHPNIVRVVGTGRTRDGRLFYAMPLLVGFERMRPNLLGRPLRIAMLLRELLAGLDDAHQCGVIHGGIKPSNVLFDEQGRAQLSDFGLARCLADAHGELADPRADLRGVGVLAYALLAGASATPRRGAIPPPISTDRSMPRLPPGAAVWQPWFERALATSPDRQFHDAREMAGALGIIASRGHRGTGGPVVTAPPKPPPKWPLRNAVPIAAIVLLLGWTVWDYMSKPIPVPDEAPAGASAETPAVPAPVSVQQPALPLAIAQPAVTAVPAAASSVMALADRVQALVDTADTLRSEGHLFSPPFHNAASQYLAAIELDPGNRSATTGIDATLTDLQARLDKSWRHARDTRDTTRMLRQGDELAKHADASARHAWRRYRGRLARTVGDAVAQATRARDARGLAALQPLAKALPAKFPAGFDPAAADVSAASATGAAPVKTPGAGTRMHDPRGPALVYVPAGGGLPAFAIGRVEVTHADYAAFARATHRPAATCLAAHNPLSRLRHLSWRDPGFSQGGDQPAVCVSWDDAAAYAAWLSKTTGKPYRLPSNGQWLRAARGMPKGGPCKLGNVDDVNRRNRLDNDRWSCDDGAAYTAPVGHYAASGVGAYDMYGNVSEWVAGGNAGSRPFRGISWRDGSHETPLGNRGTADSDVGYTSVGFRVVRVVEAAHPLPAVAPGR
jgi:hypothetical protein